MKEKIKNFFKLTTEETIGGFFIWLSSMFFAARGVSLWIEAIFTISTHFGILSLIDGVLVYNISGLWLLMYQFALFISLFGVAFLLFCIFNVLFSRIGDFFKWIVSLFQKNKEAIQQHPVEVPKIPAS